ncbi:histidine N-acetyltransferase [Biomphalaria glabrata]|nr:histidine N-acetyltransferase [Biomphalaria glabrata]
MSLAGDDIVIKKARAQDYDAIVRNGDVYGGKDYLPALYPRAVTDPDFYPIVAEVKGEIRLKDRCKMNGLRLLKPTSPPINRLAKTSGSAKMSALRGIDVVTFSEWFMAEAGLVYVVDFYARDGHSEASLQAHIARHLLQLNLCDQGVFVVSLTNNVSEEKVRALLKHHGIVEPLTNNNFKNPI